MTAITGNSGKILVTGANGYIAAWLVHALLEQGYSVRGTVRSEAKGAHLKDVFQKHGDKFEFVVVEDITKTGAFDDAVKGIDVVHHTASPFHLNADDPAELITPAVAGTGSILQSAQLHGADVKRVIVLSSCAAVVEDLPVKPVFDEGHWNNMSIKAVETLGHAANAVDKYYASKTLAERAAWAFVENNKDKLKWDLVVLNPPFVFGPALHAVDEPGSLNTSLHLWYDTTLKRVGGNDVLLNNPACWVDVRDLAEAHVLAMQKEAASGNRIIVCAGPYQFQDWVVAARIADKSVPPGIEPYNQPETVYPIRYNNNRSTTILGIKYRSMEQSARDMLDYFREKGWWGQ